MRNLVRNSRLCPCSSESPNSPSYFTLSGAITYDRCCIRGNRTCSLSMEEGGVARFSYDTPVCVCGRRTIDWGLVIRAIDADSIVLNVEFLDSSGNSVCLRTAEIACRVNNEFSMQQRRFQVPNSAASARLSVEFQGRVTAATFCLPTASTC